MMSDPEPYQVHTIQTKLSIQYIYFIRETLRQQITKENMAYKIVLFEFNTSDFWIRPFRRPF